MSTTQLAGPYEWTGGGWEGENRVLRRLPAPVPASPGVAVHRLTISDVHRRWRWGRLGGCMALTSMGSIPLIRHSSRAGVDLDTVCPGPEQAARTYALNRVRLDSAQAGRGDLRTGNPPNRPAAPQVRAAIVGTGPWATRTFCRRPSGSAWRKPWRLPRIPGSTWKRLLLECLGFRLASRNGRLSDLITEAMARSCRSRQRTSARRGSESTRGKRVSSFNSATSNRSQPLVSLRIDNNELDWYSG